MVTRLSDLRVKLSDEFPGVEVNYRADKDAYILLLDGKETEVTGPECDRSSGSLYSLFAKRLASL